MGGGYAVIGRLKPDVSHTQASDALTALSQSAMRDLRIPASLVEADAIAGRPLDAHDRGTRHVLVNETFVRQHLAGEHAIGQRLPVTANEPYRIVGMVGDVREWRLTDPPRPTFYPFTTRGAWLVVRAARPDRVAELAQGRHRAGGGRGFRCSGC